MAQTDLQQPASPMPFIAWGALAIRGILAVIFGLVALLWPEVTLLTLVQLFAIVGGIFAIVIGFAFGQADRSVRWLVRLEGVLGIVLGVVTFFWPGAAALALLYIIAAWAIITGILQIVAALGLRRAISGEWTLILGGVASVIFGVLLAVWPREGLLALVWIFGIYALTLLYIIAAWAIITGILQIVTAVGLRRAISGVWASILGGVASVIFGVLLAVWPGAGLVALVWFFGSYALVFGITQLVLAYRVRRAQIA